MQGPPVEFFNQFYQCRKSDFSLKNRKREFISDHIINNSLSSF